MNATHSINYRGVALFEEERGRKDMLVILLALLGVGGALGHRTGVLLLSLTSTS